MSFVRLSLITPKLIINNYSKQKIRFVGRVKLLVYEVVSLVFKELHLQLCLLDLIRLVIEHNIDNSQIIQ